MNFSASNSARGGLLPRATSFLSAFLKTWAGRQHRRQQVKRMRGTESLEDRTLLATFTVTNLNDTGAGSLRQAISDANGNGQTDTINFQAGLNGTIFAGSSMTISSSLTINGGNAITVERTGGTGTAFVINDGSGGTNSNVTINGLNITQFTERAINNFENLTFQNGRIFNNGFGKFTGAGINHATGTLIVSNSEISQNLALQGGGIEIDSGTANIFNSTISGNAANGHGGGVVIVAGSVTITNSTITGNSADFDNSGGEKGGGIFSNISFNLNNSIIAGNVSKASAPNDVILFSGSVAANNNLIGDAATSGGISDGAGGNIVGNSGSGTRPINTILNTTLAFSNGAPTRSHELAAGSPAINAGSNTLSVDNTASRLQFDQRGAPFVRVMAGKVDMGAIESINLGVNTLADENGTGPDNLSLREAIAIANAQPGQDVIFGMPNGTISLNMGDLVITDSVEISGPGAGNFGISGDKSGNNVFQISNGSGSLIDVQISGMGISGVRRGIRNEENLTLSNVAIFGNSTAATGGGINHDFGELVIRSSEISANTASQGGGLELNSGTVFVINSTISGNSATGNGGGIANRGGVVTTVTNSTITGNTADSDNAGGGIGGGIWNSGATYTLHNNIIGGNFRNTNNSDIQGSAAAAGSAHNLIADAATSGGITHGGDLANIVGLGGAGTRNISTVINTSLANNSGNGVFSHALVPGSIAIDNGNTVKATEPGGSTLTLDQHDGPRVVDGDGDGKNIVDIGSVEAGPMAVNGTLIFDSSNGKWRLGTVSGNTLNWTETGAFGANQRGFIGDFNGDGLLDGMMLNMSNLRFNFLRNLGNGSLAAPVSAGALNSNFTWDNFMVGDYDGNGRAEVMAQIVSPGFGQGAMRSQDSSGVNRFYVTLNTGFATLATGDFNGDGFDDVVGLFDNVTNTRANIIPAYSINTPVGRRFTSVLGSGQFGQSVATGGLHDLTVDDFNGDGRDDIAVVNSNGQIFTASTVGDARVNAADVQNFVVSNASPRLDPATYSNMILSGHFDGDNFADIFTIRDNDQLITTSTTLAANRTPIQALGIDGSSSAGELAVIGDFNGDGLEDAIILGTNAVRFLSDGTDFDLGFNFGSVIGGAIGGIGTARTGRVM